MEYIEIKVAASSAEGNDIYTSLLADAGCDSFSEDENGMLLAYIPKHNFDEDEINSIFNDYKDISPAQYEVRAVAEENWNAVWESNYAPVLIADRCYIRAPFHEKMADVAYEIEIEPKMSFGTAHHETTSLMIEYILEDEFAGKSLLDMGAGTGVLAILAHKKGAHPVTAIDIDEWAYLNNVENNARNNAEEIEVLMGGAELLDGKSFQVIIANINRNILLNDMEHYAKSLENGGIIYFSGFYVGEDLEKITEKAASLSLQFISNKEKNNWCCAKFIKKD